MVVRLRLLSVGYSVEGWSDIVGCRVTRLVCRRKTAAACILGLLCVDMYRVVTGQEEEEKLLFSKLQVMIPYYYVTLMVNCLLPFNRRRRLGTNVVTETIDATDFINNAT